MIGHLRNLIAKAIQEIEELEINIKKAEEELDKCYQLKPILNKINSNALSGYTLLQRAGNSLNAGFKIDGEGQGKNILVKSINIQKLSSNAEIGSVNVQIRIDKLEQNINMWNLKVEELRRNITGWEADIRRLEEEARRAEEAKRTLRKRNIIS